MAVELTDIPVEAARSKCGLIYDADAVTLTAHYADQVTAYRARRVWIEVLSSYFLLEEERDYDIFVDTIVDYEHFQIQCIFLSACGRYAFWRLINHQAPEAEAKLGESAQVPSKRLGGFLSSLFQSSAGYEQPVDTAELPWVITALEQQDEERRARESKDTMLKRILSLFR